MDDREINKCKPPGVSEPLEQNGAGAGGAETLPDEKSEPSLPAMQVRDFIPNDFDWVRFTKIILTLVSTIVILILAAALIGIYAWDYGLIADGVTINGVDVGHLSPAAAKAKVAGNYQSLLNQKVEFEAEGQKTGIALADLGLTYPIDTVLDQAFAIGRQGSLPQKLSAKLSASLGLNLPVTPAWNEEKLKKALQSLDYLNRPPVDATLDMNNGTAFIHKETAGRAVDIPRLAGEVKSLKPDNIHPLHVPLREIEPAVTSAQLENLKPTGILAAYTTHFDPSLLNRTQNIRIAATTIDGLLLKPGEDFSFNERVGPRTEKAGYLDAMIIENGEFVPGLGGGVCQVSTTLYNSILLADLPITERANHALAITYAPLGQDATVAYGSLDLKFRNDSGGYLLIRSLVKGDALTFTIYGKAVPEKEVLISDQILQTLPPHEQTIVDPSLPAGTSQVRQSGQSGYIVRTTRTVKIKGETTKTENLGTSSYQSLPRVIAVAPR